MTVTKPFASYSDLAGRVVFISGGATGIGHDLVTAFAGQDAIVLFVDIDETAGASLASKLGANTHFIPCDVTSDQDLCAALDRAEAMGPLDVLVNNAANDTRMTVAEVSADDWERTVNVNLRHQFIAAQHVARQMQARGRGAIINFGSVAPEMMVENLAVYSTCKAAVRGLTRSLARDLGHHGIRVNSILPGCIMTDRQRALWFKTQSDIDAAVAQQCLKRELNGQDVAAMALFLASDVSAACTAQDFIVDGGLI